MSSLPPEPPPPPDPSVDPALAGPPSVCPHCGAPHEPLQEYCLECGLRLPSPYYAGVTRTIWSRESPVWLWAALASLLLVALVAGAIVAVAATRDEEQAKPNTTTPTASTPIGSDTAVFPTEQTITIQPPTTTLPTTTALTTIGTTTIPTTTTTTTTTGGTVTWPAGKDGYTIVLKSTPTSDGRSDADAAATRARNEGLPQVGVLNSSDYSSLRPGYYVTFTGIYDTLAQAQAALPSARANGFPLAYVREVSE